MNAIVEHTNGWVSFVERAMSNPDYSVDKLQALLEMRRAEAREAARHDFNRAMAEVQSELQQVSKDKPNPAHRSKYATLAALLAEAQPVYTSHGFSLRFGTGQPVRPDWVRVTCEIAHLGGWSEQHYLDGPIDTSGNKTPIQTIGSTVTYLRRYLLMMLLNLVAADDVADDDGETQRRDRQAADAYSAREAINASVTLRAAAAPMPRGASISEKTQTFDPNHPLEEPDPGRWLLNLEQMLAAAETQQEVVELANYHSVGEATAKAPRDVKARISELLALAYGRFAEPAPSEASGWPGPDPSSMAREREAAGA